MKRVIIESPFAGDVALNQTYALRCLLDSLERGDEAPLASHLLYTQVLDDKVPEQRQRGINAGVAWYEVAEICAVYIDYGITPGMLEGIKAALGKGVRVEHRKIGK
jgi:hypothetical protein